MTFRWIAAALVFGFAANVNHLVGADARPTLEDPSYEPADGRVRQTPSPREVGLSDTGTPAPVKPPVVERKPTRTSKKSERAPKVAADEPVVQPKPPAPVETTTYPTALDPRTGTVRRIKYVLDGQNVFEGDPDPTPAAPRISTTAPVIRSETDGRVRNSVIDPRPGDAVYVPASPVVSTPSPRPLVDDLTADKPGTAAAAAEKPLFDEIKTPDGVNSKARKCYTAMDDLKKNLESINRLLDNRGKENARLIHTSEQVIENINDLVAIWPNSDAFRDYCVSAKRSALQFNSELNQSPWRWNYVRWSFSALLRDARPLREMGKSMAESEPKAMMLVGKDGKVIYKDAPDPLEDPITLRRKAEQAELERLRAAEEEKQSSKKDKEEKLRRDLDTK